MPKKVKAISPLVNRRVRDIIKKNIDKVLETSNTYIAGNLDHVARHCFEKRDDILKLASNHKTPFYVLDIPELSDAITTFATSFTRHIPSVKVYYAVKTNYEPRLLKEIATRKLGFDVSSKRELVLTLKAGGTDILYTGPGKTEDDLEYAIQHADKVTINIDSFGELKRLGNLTNKKKKKIRAGVRIYTDVHGKWSKFGIKLEELVRFWHEAQKYKYIDLCGIQFHISWNESAGPYIQIIKQLATYLRTSFTPEERKKIKFIDFGGGFRPYQSEGVHPWDTPVGSLIKTVFEQSDKKLTFQANHIITQALPIEEYAKRIGAAIYKHLNPLVTCEYYTEPGRVICNNAMHLVVSVIDKKSDDMVITDGGVHMTGWERFIFDYFPVLNMTNPAIDEKKCTIYGSLCMPQDLFGYYYYGACINEDDVLLVPYQGHLTYSLAQNFIKEIPEVHVLL